MRTILHIDMNSYFATVEQQANPRLRGKPVGVTGGDRLERTVLGTASVEAKKKGVKTGMTVWEAKKICPDIIIIPGDSDKYLATTTKILNIFKDYTPNVEVFSIDEAFLELPPNLSFWQTKCVQNPPTVDSGVVIDTPPQNDKVTKIALEIKQRIKSEVGDYLTCSVGISFNKLLAKLAGSLQKPNGLVIISDQKTAIKILDQIELDEVCGIGLRIKRKLFNLGVTNFKQLRKVPKDCLLASFKGYGEVLYNMARGIDNSTVIPFFEKEEVKSIGHRHTLMADTSDFTQLKQILLKISEMIAQRLRAKKLVGKTIHCFFRYSGARTFHLPGVRTNEGFEGGGMQKSRGEYTKNGMDIFKTAWEILSEIWDGNPIRMVGVSVSNLKPENPKNIFLLKDDQRQETIMEIMDKINSKFGDCVLQRGTLLTTKIKRNPNSFLSDRRFKYL